jgi:large subunit ribosomal protein L15
VIKHEPEYFGKRGFKSPKALKSQVNVVNVGQLEEIVTKLELEKKLEKKSGKPFLNLEKLGYHKLLGAGRLTKAITVKVPFCSERAAQKVKEAGGKVIGITSETQ